MVRRCRNRNLKWTGFGLLFLILGIWGASLEYRVSIPIGQRGFVGMDSGFVFAGGVDNVRLATSANEIYAPLSWGGIGLAMPSYTVEANAGEMFQNCRYLGIPLWLPLLLAAIPTAWFWYRDRNPRSAQALTAALN